MKVALLVFVAMAASGCATWKTECQGDPTALPCTCGGQQNPGCSAPLNDDNPPWAQDAKRKTDGGQTR